MTFERAVRCAALVVLSYLCFGAVAARSPQPAERRQTDATPTRAAFPLEKVQGRRCLRDEKEAPFLLHGDAAWSLLVQLTREEADDYLKDRRRRGYNTILANLLERKFARRAPFNAYGEAPFATHGNFTRPNERYFAHVDWVLERAADHGFLVLLAPAYLGYGGAEQGWYREMRAAGPERLRAYGRYLGERYRSAKNLIWIHGGDFNPPDFGVVRAVLDGILEKAPDSQNSFHGARGTSSHEYLPGAQWLFVDTVYTDEHGVASAANAAHAASRNPFILIEARYEDEGASASVVRAQAYQAVLSGACGQVAGHKHVWPFDPKWKAALDSPGARSLSRMRFLLDMLAWWDLSPARPGFVVEGAGTGGMRAAAALDADGRRAVVYVPSARVIALDATYLDGVELRATWLDPTPAAREPIVRRAALGAGRQVALRTPGHNGSGDDDWLVVLDSVR